MSIPRLLRVVAIAAFLLSFATVGLVDAATFNGDADHMTDAFGYYYAMTGGKFPTGTTPNGDNASGGTFRFILDATYWGRPMGVWHKDDWFPDNASIALTLKNGSTTVYDNNGIEDGTHGGYYDGTGVAASADVHGLYRGFSMSNNYDWIYAGYFKLEQETQITTLIGYFDENSGFDRNNPLIDYRMNIWSNVDGDLLPVNTGAFTGDVFSSDYVSGTFSTSYSGIDRIYGDDYGNVHDEIFRLTYELDTPITLAAGEYWFSHDAIITPEPGTLAIWATLGGLGLMSARRRRRRAA